VPDALYHAKGFFQLWLPKAGDGGRIVERVTLFPVLKTLTEYCPEQQRSFSLR
jgi:hypothetical protein